MKKITVRKEFIFFKRWSNKGFAVLNSFHKIIHIGILSIACNILQTQSVLCQSDTASPSIFYTLEEVEAISGQESEFYSPLLRQILIIDQDQLDISPARSIPDVLDYFPGVDLRTRGVNGIQADLSIQGGSFDQSLVLLNGIDMSNPQTGHFSMDVPVDISQIKRLEVLKGPAATKYGLNAYSGAINMISSPEDSLSISTEATYGQFNAFTGKGLLNVPLGFTTNLIAASIAGSDGYMENTDYATLNLYTHSRAENSFLKSDLMLGWNQKKYGANAFYTPKYPDQFEETKSILAALKFQTKNKPSQSSGNLYWKRHYDHYLLFRSNPSAYENYHKTDVLGAAFAHKIRSPFGITDVELNFRHEQIFSTRLGEILDNPLSVKGTDKALYNHYKARNHLNLSLKHTAQIQNIYINAGALIHTGIEDLSSPGIYPGFDLSYIFNKEFSLFGSVNKAMRLPTFTDLYYEGPMNRGNPDLKPERSVTFESGAKYTKNLISTDLAFFYRKGKETIDWIWNDPFWQTENITDLDTYGVETSLTVSPSEIGTTRLQLKQLRISYAYTKLSKSSESFISNYALDNLKHKFILDFSLNLPLHIYIDTKIYRQARNGSYLIYETPASSPLEAPYDPFWLIDLNAGIKLGKITFFINAMNLFDNPYRDIGSVRMPGRWLMAGFKFR